MQNSRIDELEKLIHASAPMSPMTPRSKSSPGPSAPSADTEKLKEEVRVLQEALDVMQQQVDEYEKALKDNKRSSRGVRTAGGRVTPKKTMDLEATLSQLGQAAGTKSPTSSRDVLLESISLETALFRPALSSAVQSANYWKTKAMGSALSKLAPLSVSVAAQSMPSFSQGASSANDQARCLDELYLAKNELRLAKASFSIVDLSKNDVPSRAQLTEQQRTEQMAEVRLKEATSSWLKLTQTADSLASFPPPSSLQTRTGGPVGRITLPCRDGVGFVAPLTVNTPELRDFHSFLVQ